MWDKCGMARNEAGLREALDRIPDLRQQFWRDLIVPGCGAEMNQQLETADRVADFLELAELLVLDALVRSESCGGHFREESQTAEGEARRDDEHFAYVSAWEFTGVGQDPVLHKEPLVFEAVLPAERNYVVKFTLRIWRQAGPEERRPPGHLRRRPCQSGHVVSRDARQPQ